VTDVFSLLIRPQYYDFDPSSIVHNATYVRWLEDGRIAFQQSSPWPTERLYAADMAAVLTRTEIHYKRPVRLSENVLLRVWVLSVGRSALSLALRFVHPETETEYACAEQSGCFVRRSTGRPIAMPAEFLEFCRQYKTRFGAPGNPHPRYFVPTPPPFRERGKK